MLKHELVQAALPAAPRLGAPTRSERAERAVTRRFDVFRLVVALSGLAAIIGLPLSLIAGVLLLWG